ncbi:MAG: RCC1 domain-containing protein, partial [Baekduiaceae bacterium]
MRPAAVLVALLAAALLAWPAASPASSANGATPAARGDAGTLSMLLNTRCLVTQSGAVRCWGYNVNGELGFAPAGNPYWGDAPGETPQAVNLGLGVTAQAVAVGSYASCALSDIGEVLCWGPWTPGEVRQIDLGTGNAAKAISVGTDHGCAVLTTGGVRCWGANAYGQLAQGTTSSPGATTSVPVDLGPGRTAVAVDAGYQASCAILDTGALPCWGRNQFGQLAQGNIDTIGDDPSETTVGVDLGPGRTATAIVSGATSCAILDTGALRCWGVNNFGQLAQGNTDWVGDDPGETTVPVDLGGAKALSVATDGNGVCAVLESGGLRCWGRSHLGAALQGDTNDIGDTTGETTVPVNLGAGRTALAVAVAKGTVCLVDQARTLRCWGGGTYGGRASQDSNHYGTAPSETSAAAIAPVGLGELAVRDWDGDGVRDSADGCRLVAAATATGCPAPPPPAPPQNP